MSLTSPSFSPALTPVYPPGQPCTPYNFVANIYHCFVFLPPNTHTPLLHLSADNSIDLNAIKASLLYNEHFVPRCAILWQGLPLSQGWRPIKGIQFMSPGGKKKNKTSLHFNYRIVQESRNLGHHVEFLRYSAKGGTGREVREMGSGLRTS